jgi:hypothetical protein
MLKMAIKDIEIVKTEILSNNWYTLKKITYQYSKSDGDGTTAKPRSLRPWKRCRNTAI